MKYLKLFENYKSYEIIKSWIGADDHMENFTDDEVEYIRNLFEGINCTIDVVKKRWNICNSIYVYIFNNCVFSIFKYEDEWFQLSLNKPEPPQTYTETTWKNYKCDQLSGLEELINDIIKK